MRNAIKALVAAAALAMAPAAFAADFAEVDTDANGEVTLAEGQAVHADWTQEAFDDLDTDGNGTLSQAEYEAAMEATDQSN